MTNHIHKKAFYLATIVSAMVVLPAFGAPALDVPDNGTTASLLGLAMAGLALIRRKVR